MQAREILAEELQHQPEAIAYKLLDYLHSLSPTPIPSQKSSSSEQTDYFISYWSRFYGAFEQWDEPFELPAEKREDW